MGLEERILTVTLPPGYENNGWARRWQRQYRPSEVPLVVKEEQYYFGGVGRKLQLGYRLLHSFLEHGMLEARTTTAERSGRHYGTTITSLSLAQLVSDLFHLPLGDVLISEQLFREQEFLRKPVEERLKMLMNAYTGTWWFETFRRWQEQFRGSVPHFSSFQRLGLHEVRTLLGYSSRTNYIQKLYAKSIIILRNGRTYLPKSLHNDADPRALAWLISRMRNIPLKEIIANEHIAVYRLKLGQSFHRKKVLPYLKEHAIDPPKFYTISQAAKISGIDFHRLYEATSRGFLHYTLFLKKDTRIRGIDLALYALKNTEKSTFSAEEIAELFGVRKISLSLAGFGPEPPERLTRNHYVSPLYDRITAPVREQVLRDASRREAHRYCPER